MAQHEFVFPTNDTPVRTPKRRELLINTTVVLVLGLIAVITGLALKVIPLGVMGTLLVIGSVIVLMLTLISGGRFARSAR